VHDPSENLTTNSSTPITKSRMTLLFEKEMLELLEVTKIVKKKIKLE